MQVCIIKLTGVSLSTKKKGSRHCEPWGFPSLGANLMFVLLLYVYEGERLFVQPQRHY